MHVYPLGGLYDECYNPCLSDLSIRRIRTQDDLRRLNGAFWGWLLSPERIRAAIESLQNHWRFVPSGDLPHRWDAVIKAPELFRKRVTAALEELTRYDLTEQELYGAIESISTVCELYSKMLFPCILTVTEGFSVPNTSSRILVKDCLVPASNPYLPFLEEYCFPFLKESHPDVLFLHGAPHISTFAMAYRVKLWFPDTHISLCDHSTEYFSLNKISKNLENNRYLSTIIDEIVFNEEETYPFRETLTRGRVSHVPDALEHATVVCGKLYPNRICPWRKCSFCGINAKYPHNGKLPDEPMEKKISAIKEAVADGAKYFWFYDEALPSSLLQEFAQAILDKNLSFIWQARSRLDEDFTSELCFLLAHSGLREIRFGLEAANVDVQKTINKFEHFDLDQIEETIKRLINAGIGVHMPCIVGFPNETAAQRQETYDFLARMRSFSSLFTFNVNVLTLDVASDFFCFPKRFGLTDIKLPHEDEVFLGNIAESWSDVNGPVDRAALNKERNSIMRDLLYDWMPPKTLTPVNFYYRLAENLRLTLRWKHTHTDGVSSTVARAPAQSPWLVHFDDNNTAIPAAFDFALYKSYNI